MSRRAIVCVAAAALLAVSCGAKNKVDGGESGDDNPTTTTAAAGGSSDGFGTLASPCGAGSAKVSAADAGKGADKLYVGVANDRTSEIRPGLLAELWDAGVGFAKWCNEQGGIDGLQIEPVDLDGKLLSVEAAMAKACTDVFAEHYHSFEFGMKKPDPRSFTKLMERMGTDPARCWFIDDKKSNVEGAHLAGLAGHHFVSREQLLPQVHAMGFTT